MAKGKNKTDLLSGDLSKKIKRSNLVPSSEVFAIDKAWAKKATKAKKMLGTNKSIKFLKDL